jgi:hypothetical protein
LLADETGVDQQNVAQNHRHGQRAATSGEKEIARTAESDQDESEENYAQVGETSEDEEIKFSDEEQF